MRHSRSVSERLLSLAQCLVAAEGQPTRCTLPAAFSPPSGSRRSETLEGETAGLPLRVEVAGRPPGLPARVSLQFGSSPAFATVPSATIPFGSPWAVHLICRQLCRCRCLQLLVVGSANCAPGRHHAYMVVPYVPLVSRVLVDRLEEGLGQELRQRGVCHPTTWFLTIVSSHGQVHSGSAATYFANAESHEKNVSRLSRWAFCECVVPCRGFAAEPQNGVAVAQPQPALHTRCPRQGVRRLSRNVLRKQVSPRTEFETAKGFIICKTSASLTQRTLYSGRLPLTPPLALAAVIAPHRHREWRPDRH